MSSKDADGRANSADPHQTASLPRPVCLKTYEFHEINLNGTMF